MANGHIFKLVDIVKEIKRLFPDIYLMVGNIANPETYKILSESGADGIRCAIGNGNACLSASNLGINYPMASLIIECKELKETYKFKTEIIADGGMRNYSDIIKALGLGADKVMVGSIFNKCIESAGDNYL
jgi:isopentenyl diphosphate isomerase/L-lactate dehydrogenase-like FMN-dependent dehydrogenase